ncbi:MAG: dihydroneopterin aldolase, partial [Lachnospiraceae bacterium]|nr:dihydroneopterin aldolase [Lachnospiraceae bacterium]
MDQIWIRDLKLFAYHGVYEEEKRAGQDFLVSGRFFLNLQEAGITDELDCSVSYDELCVFISRIFTEKRRDLLEAVAEDLCRAVFKEYPKIMEIELSIYKPEAPVRAEVSKVGITVRRKRHRVFIGVGANEGE